MEIVQLKKLIHMFVSYLRLSKFQMQLLHLQVLPLFLHIAHTQC